MSKKTSKSGFNKIKKKANGTIFLNSHVGKNCFNQRGIEKRKRNGRGGGGLYRDGIRKGNGRGYIGMV